MSDLLQQIIKVPTVVSRYGYSMRNFVDNVQFLNRYLINLVQYIYRRYVDTVSFDNV